MYHMTSFKNWPLAIALIACLMFAASNINGQEAETQKAEDDTHVVAEQSPEDALVEAVNESLRVYLKEIKPTSQKIQDLSREIYMRMGNERTIISKLKKANDETLAKIRKERDQLTSRVEQLNRIEDALTDMNPDGKEKAIAAAEENLVDLEERRKEIQQPVMDELSEMQRAFRAKNELFAKLFSVVLKEEGEGDFAEWTRKSMSGNFAYCQMSSRYVNEKKSVTVSIMLNNPVNLGNSKRKLIAGKYPALLKSKSNLHFAVGKVQVSAHTSSKTFEEGELEKFVMDVVNLEKVEELFKDIKK
ncbi:MAG: hypothetical protein AB8B55_04505 [Mariniblastus sp.]